MGAAKVQMVKQFLGESLLLALISFIIAVLLIDVTIPVYNNLTGKSLGIFQVFSLGNVLILNISLSNLTKVMLKIIRIALQLLIPLVAIIYGLGDYLNWWDNLSGRTGAISGYNRLASNEGSPKILIYDNEPDFHRLYQFLKNRITAQEFISLDENNKRPNVIARAGGSLGHELQKQLK